MNLYSIIVKLYCFLMKAIESGIRDVIERSTCESFEEKFVINAYSQVCTAKNKLVNVF